MNGLIDRYLYDAELVDTSLPFENLREISHINLLAGYGADAEGLATPLEG